MRLFIFLSLFISQSVSALSLGHEFHLKSLKTKSLVRPDGSLRIMETNRFDQKLDHKTNNPVTFKQRYFVDSHYATNTDSPVFLVICGEWNCAGTSSSAFVEGLAQKMKAHIVALEHRYYGESYPFAQLTPQNLRFLTLNNAIEDLANFQRFMMKTRKLTGKWVSFGGSYAGTLSAFYRLKHPELVVGALASSGPVLMKPEFSEYDGHIASVINKTSCGDKVRTAVALIEKKMETPAGGEALRKQFKAENLKDDGDFLYVVADMLAAAVQYGRDVVFCDAINAATDPVEGYAKGGLAVLAAMGSTPEELSLSNASKVPVTPSDYFRQWMWQSCQEFGWFQVANGTGKNTSRSFQVDLKYHEKICERAYNRPMRANGSLNTSWYNNLFNPKTTHIIFSNGSNDPWSTLSVIPGARHADDLDLMMMDGAAHCNDLKLARLPSVIAAQGKIEALVKTWIGAKRL